MIQDTPATILEILDRCCDAYTFPMLDNGYVYLAATRLSLFRSADDWALAIEVFGFSPRAGRPDVGVHTFGSRLYQRDTPAQHPSPEAYQNYLANNPHNDSRFFYPLADGAWQDPEDLECVAPGAREVVVRGTSRPLPRLETYEQHGIALQDPPRICVFELCRLLAAIARSDVLASAGEQRVSVLPDMSPILQLDEWHHPDVVRDSERPSGSDTFRQLAEVLVSGDVSKYRPSTAPNTHWSHWPDGGTL
jgi:hypothetical protein